MPVLYKLYKMVRTFKDGRTDKAANHWFARAITLGTMTTDDVAELVQRNCSMKKSDVKAVIEELIDVIRDKIQESYAVKLDGLGTFKIGLKSSGAETVADFNVTQNIVGSHILFYPSRKVNSATGKQTIALLEGLKVQETAKNTVSKA